MKSWRSRNEALMALEINQAMEKIDTQIYRTNVVVNSAIHI